MLTKTLSPIEITYKDTRRYKFIPQIKNASGDWETVTPETTFAQLEDRNNSGVSLQDLVVINLGDNEYAVDFYADDSIFDETPSEQVIEPNKEFYLCFYWTYDASGTTINKSKRLLLKVVNIT